MNHRLTSLSGALRKLSSTLRKVGSTHEALRNAGRTVPPVLAVQPKRMKQGGL